MTLPAPAPRAVAGKWLQLGWIALATALAMSLWLSASAVVPQLAEEWELGNGGASWITMSVQLGFVAGALASAGLNLPDRVPARRLFAVSAVVGAAANAAIALPALPLAAVMFLRFATGVALAGVYPTGMKLVATWCREDRGLGIGVLVGALTLGTAMPHLLNTLVRGGVGLPPWRPVLLHTSVMALLSAGLALLLVRPGPFHATVAPFDWRVAGRALAHRPTRLANFGYLGHMWELYAMWAWAPLFLLASYEASGLGEGAARAAGFAVIAVGAPGCVVAGLLADRVGRTTVTGWSLAVSGICCLVAGSLFHRPGALTVVCLVWGFAVVADSAQFSAAVSELGDPRYVGTALTVQTCLGFLLTLVTLRIVPPLVERVGWERVFVVLAVGPALGLASMMRLRRLPEARRLASGRR